VLQSSATPPSPLPEPPRRKNARLRELYGMERILWRGKIGPAFWNIASLASLSVNIFLFIILILLGRELFTLKNLVEKQLVGGLYTNFVKMDQSHIVTTIQVKDTIKVVDTIPVVFDLPLHQETTVVLTKDTPVKKATIYLNGAAVPLDIILRKGTPLNIALDLVVPVNQTIPVELNVPVDLSVPVDISLAQTDLHQPFTGLQAVVAPYNTILQELPDSWKDTPLCGPFSGWMCKIFLGAE